VPSFVDLPALLLGADRILPSGRVIGVIIGAVILLGMFCAWLVVRSLRKSALKSWAASRNLQYDKGRITGFLEGYQVELLFDEHDAGGSRSHIRGACRVMMRSKFKLPDKLFMTGRKLPNAKFEDIVLIDSDDDFNAAVTITAPDAAQVYGLLKRYGVRRELAHLLSARQGIEIKNNSVSATIDSALGMGNDIGPVFDEPLRRCGEVVKLLEAAISGEVIPDEQLSSSRPRGAAPKVNRPSAVRKPQPGPRGLGSTRG